MAKLIAETPNSGVGAMRRLLIITTLVEALFGLVLFLSPAIPVRLLFGAQIAGVGVVMSRIGGIALIALAIACWPGLNMSSASYAMATYNTLVAVCLAFVGFSGEAGILLWPATVFHLCVSALLLGMLGKRQQLAGRPSQR